MTEIVKDRIFFHLEPARESSLMPGEVVQESWIVSVSSPESGLLDRIRFEVPALDSIKDQRELGRMFAAQLAVGAAMGFRNGVLAGSIGRIEDIDPDKARLKDLVTAGEIIPGIDRHRRNVAESARRDCHEVVDWIQPRFSLVRK